MTAGLPPLCGELRLGFKGHLQFSLEAARAWDLAQLSTDHFRDAAMMKLPFARALIVDDEPHSQMRLQFALEQVGFQCDLAHDGDEALKRVSEYRYQVIVTELILPETNGGELIIQLCAQESAPIVTVHTRVLEQEVYWGLKREGVDAIFYKPADYSTMARKIHALVAGDASPQTAAERWKKWQKGAVNTVDHRMYRILRQGDDWIQRSSFRIEAFRFSIIILACILFGMGWGNSLDASMAGVCKMFGLCGFAFYFCLELVAYHRTQHRAKLLQWSAERRLAEQTEFHAETPLARIGADLPRPRHPADAC